MLLLSAVSRLSPTEQLITGLVLLLPVAQRVLAGVWANELFGVFLLMLGIGLKLSKVRLQQDASSPSPTRCEIDEMR